MIAALTGRVLTRSVDHIVLDVNGVGYRVEAAPAVTASCHSGDTVSLQTQLVVREDSLTLFGFLDEREQQMFNLLLSVTGVGPKSALGVLSVLSAAQIVAAIKQEDYKPFTSVSGIGAKIAKQIVLSLSGRIKTLEFAGDENAADEPAAPQTADIAGSAAVIAALVGLGWPEQQASAAVTDALAAGISAADQPALLRAALALLQR